MASGVSLTKANSLHEALFALGFAVGPAIGAFLIGFVGTIMSFGVIADFFGVAFVAVLLIPQNTTTVSDDEADDPGVWWRDAIEGFRVIGADKALLVVTLFIVFVDFIYMPSEVVILPTYFESINNPRGMGIVISAMAVGGVLGAYSFAPLEARFSLRTIILGSALTSSVLLFGLAFFPPVWVMALFGFAVGMAWGPMAPRSTPWCKPGVGPLFRAECLAHKWPCLLPGHHWEWCLCVGGHGGGPWCVSGVSDSCGRSLCLRAGASGCTAVSRC